VRGDSRREARGDANGCGDRSKRFQGEIKKLCPGETKSRVAHRETVIIPPICECGGRRGKEREE